jgi:hypothetical protein
VWSIRHSQSNRATRVREKSFRRNSFSPLIFPAFASSPKSQVKTVGPLVNQRKHSRTLSSAIVRLSRLPEHRERQSVKKEVSEKGFGAPG